MSHLQVAWLVLKDFSWYFYLYSLNLDCDLFLVMCLVVAIVDGKQSTFEQYFGDILNDMKDFND